MPLTIGSDGSGELSAGVELRGVGVRYTLPVDRIGSFKEFVLKRLAGEVETREFWALRGVDLEIRLGEVFGVVGRNGAGKSTLLKVISRVLRPTRGRVIVHGRVAPMLELGAGFHQDLTGRENVFLNASILGYPRKAVERHFDEIAEFASLSRFIEAPIRSYSSGMLARLGFSVATLFRPDVLLLDEVLAVGDLGFQRKCLDRISEFRRQGTTIILVSHNLETIARYCTRTAWLANGEVAALGPTAEVLTRYQASQETPPRSDDSESVRSTSSAGIVPAD